MARRRRGRGATGRRLAIIAAVALIVPGALVAARLPLARLAIDAALRAQNISVASIDAVRLDPGGIEIADVALEGGGASARRIAVDPDLSDPTNPRIARLAISGLRIEVALAADGALDLRGLDRLMAPSGETGGGTSLPRRVEIDDARLCMESPSGAIELAGGGVLEMDEAGRASSGALAFTIGPVDEAAARSGVSGTLKVAPDGAGVLHAVPDISIRMLPLGPATLVGARIAGDVALGAAGIAGTGEITLGRGTMIAGLTLAEATVLRLSRGGDGRIALAPAPIRASAADMPVEVLLPATTLEPGTPARASARGGGVALPTAGVALDDLAFDGAPTGGRITGRVRSLADPALVAPLALDAGVGRDEAGAWRANGTLRSADGAISARLSARHEAATGAGAARLALPPMDLAPPRDLKTLFPALGARVKSASGKVGLVADANWGRSLGTRAEATLADLSLDLGGLALRRANGIVRLDRIWPPATPPGQRLAFAGLDLGVPLTDGRLEFGIDRAGSMNVARAELGFAGGRVVLRERMLRPFDPPVALTLGVTGVDLARVLALAGLPGLSGEGRLDGDIPVNVSAAGVEIPQARLSAEAPGRLRYAPDVLPAALQGDDPKIKLAVEALKDLRYDHLVLVLSRHLGGEAELGLSLKGRNPAVYDGFPLSFNVNLEGRLDEIARSALAGWQVPDDIRKEIESSAARPPETRPPQPSP